MVSQWSMEDFLKCFVYMSFTLCQRDLCAKACLQISGNLWSSLSFHFLFVQCQCQPNVDWNGWSLLLFRSSPAHTHTLPSRSSEICQGFLKFLSSSYLAPRLPLHFLVILFFASTEITALDQPLWCCQQITIISGNILGIELSVVVELALSQNK